MPARPGRSDDVERGGNDLRVAAMLTLKDGYRDHTGGSGAITLTFSYIVGAGQKTSDPTATRSISIPRATPTALAMLQTVDQWPDPDRRR